MADEEKHAAGPAAANAPPAGMGTTTDSERTPPTTAASTLSGDVSHGNKKEVEEVQDAGADYSDEDEDDIVEVEDPNADIDLEDIEVAVPGYSLDRRLSKAHDVESLRRIESRSSRRSRASRILSRVSTRRSKKGGIRIEPIPVTNLDEGIVGWESQDDPEMPLNFPKWKKWLLVTMLAAITLLTPFASSILSPGIAALGREFHNSDTIVGTMTVSIYLLGYVVGPLFLAPLSEIYGRKIVLGAANANFCVWQIGCALAPNIASLIVFRFFAGLGGAGCMTLGAGIVGDLFRPQERGFAMGMWTLGPIIGPTIGPLIGGYLTESKLGWRWDFWIVLIIAVPITLAMEIFGSETSHRLLIHRKVQRMKKELNRDDLRSCYQSRAETQTAFQILMNGLTRPLKLLFLSPIVSLLSVYIAFTYGVLYLLFTTIPTVFMQQYGFSVGSTGLVYLSLGAANLVGWVIMTLYSDRSVVRLARANDGKFEPEMRLPLSLFFGFFMPITFFWYGWCAYYKTHWIWAVLALAPYGLGCLGVFMAVATYLVDSYPMYAASAFAANMVCRSLVGALLPLAGPPMYRSLGLGWGNSLLGFICVGLVPMPLFFYKFGARLRKMQKFEL